MGLFHNIFGLPQTAGQNGVSGKRTSFSSGKDTVTLTKGEVVKGEVTDLRSNEVTIRLEDGKTLHAKLSTAMDLSIGQKAEFFVQETNDVLITLKLLSDGDTSFTESAIDKALEASGFPKSQHAADIVRSLLNAGLPANKEMIQKMMQYSAANKDVELSTLTALLKHNLPVSKENATQLQAYRNFEHRLLGQAATLTASLTDAFSYGEASASFTEGILSLFFGEDTGTQKTFTSMQSMPEPSTDAITGNQTGQSNDVTSSTGNLSGLPLGETLVNGDTTMLTGSDSFPASGTLSASGDVQTVSAEASSGNITNSATSEDQLPLKQLLSDAAYSSVEKALETLASDSPEFSSLQADFGNGTLTAKQFFSALSSGTQNGLSEKISSLFKEEPALSELLGKTVLNEFVLTPEDLTKEHSIEAFYARTAKTLTKLSELTSGESNSAALKTVADTASNMQENIQFMNTLNHIFPYVQLPLKLTEQLTHGELYVYTKKKDLSAKNKEVSILLHLDMDALGPTDVHLTLLQQNVTARFYLNESDAEALVSEQLPSLTEALQKKGYSLNASVMHRDKEPDIVSDFLEDRDATPMKRFRFDIRA